MEVAGKLLRFYASLYTEHMLLKTEINIHQFSQKTTLILKPYHRRRDIYSSSLNKITHVLKEKYSRLSEGEGKKRKKEGQT